jgi:N-acetylmuramoyl-L-alanine amidase
VAATPRPRRRLLILIATTGAVASTAISACGSGHPAATAHPVTASSAPTATVAITPATSTTTQLVPAATTTVAASTTTRVTASPTTKAPAAAGGTGPLRGKTILLDPGHNGGNFSHTAAINQQVFVGNGSKACDTTGTVTNDGYTEAAYNFDVATRLAALLRTAGATVVLTRPDNTGFGPCVTKRADIGNQAHADAALSIHADGGPSGGRGFHVIQPAPVAANSAIVAPSDRLALDVRRDYQGATGMPFSTYAGSNALETRSDLGGLNMSSVPKVFIETGNMRNATDAALLESAGFRQQVAVGLVQAFTDFLAGQ